MSCITPFTVMHKLKGSVPVPCGRCPNCVKRRISGWSFRLMQEERNAASSYFITLTYDTSKVPISTNGFMNLSKKDLQDYFKRLRKAHGESRIKYYVVGEYGGKTMRPHYHMIIFNADITKIDPAWNNGQVHFGSVTEASIGYCFKYMMKKSRVPMHERDDRQREFSLMSKGLGESYIRPSMIAWHKANLIERMYCNLKDGKKIAMPRYYKEKIYNEMERKRVAHFAKFSVQKKELAIMKKQGDAYFANLASKHRAAFKKMQFQSSKNEKL